VNTCRPSASASAFSASGLAPGLSGTAEHAGDGVAAGDEGFQDGLAEFLLSDEGDAGDGGLLGQRQQEVCAQMQ
jgi:hypothetical protein